MATWPQIGPVVPLVIAPFFTYPQFTATANASATFSAANRAFFYPIYLDHPILVTVLWWVNGAAVAGNVDVGIYTDQGNRLLSTGSTLQAGTNVPQSVDVTDTVIPEGLVFFAIAASSASATFWRTAATSGDPRQGSFYNQDTAFPLPNPATFGHGAAIWLYKFGALRAPRTVL